jgi:hypothetical protein
MILTKLVQRIRQWCRGATVEEAEESCSSCSDSSSDSKEELVADDLAQSLEEKAEAVVATAEAAVETAAEAAALAKWQGLQNPCEIVQEGLPNSKASLIKCILLEFQEGWNKKEKARKYKKGLRPLLTGEYLIKEFGSEEPAVEVVVEKFFRPYARSLLVYDVYERKVFEYKCEKVSHGKEGSTVLRVVFMNGEYYRIRDKGVARRLAQQE